MSAEVQSQQDINKVIRFRDLNESADDVSGILSEALFPALADISAQPSEHHVILLKDAMNDLKKTTNRTHDAVEIIATTFDQVHAKVRELLRVTNDKAGLAQQAEKLAVLHAYTTSLKFHQITAAIKTSQDAVDNMKGVLRTAQDSYDRASKNYPSTMEVFGASVAMAFTDCVTSAISQLVPAFVNNMNMANKIESGIDVVTKDSLVIAKDVKSAVKPITNDKDSAKTVDYASDPHKVFARTEIVVILTLMATSIIDINTKINSLLIHFEAIETFIGYIVYPSETLLKKIQLELNEVDKQTKKGPVPNATYFEVLGDSAKSFGEVLKTFITADDDLRGLKVVREAGRPFPMQVDKDSKKKQKSAGDANDTPDTDTNSSTGTIDSEQALMLRDRATYFT
ncbi:hypothetical protein H2198_008370 [Neophaeococcomyces mojaviensis]|uniref:Uncharacterized protein n=1 Tax=Neophaeococcomyces mojaviensis TaxID=3383035 RepID=A0ACC2ZXC7_9EURO|nr:hypothetical protein H2198_008370 [Knufia sp. JES_112]